MDRRNEYMVDHSEYLIAVWTGIMTGTGRTVEYTGKMNRRIFLLNPASSKDGFEKAKRTMHAKYAKYANTFRRLAK